MTEPTANPRKRVSLVIPMYNEGDAIDVLFARLDTVLPTLASYEFEIVCVNDGSTDQTLDTLTQASATRANLVVVDLSRNFGKEAALSAGLFIATGDAVIPMDADLQDPPEAIKDLLAKWEDGFEVVLARRSDRSSDSMAKRFTAQSFYRIHNAVADVEIPADVGDFRLMDRVVVEALNALPEGRRFMKGLFAWVGFKTTTIDYRRDARAAGNSKFNAWKLWNFALEGIFSFSISPLKIWTYLGFFVALAAVGWGGWIALRTLVWGVDVPGYASVLVGVLLLGGLQLIGIGMIGEYLGRAFLESKRRPAYLIRQVLRTGDDGQRIEPSSPSVRLQPNEWREPSQANALRPSAGKLSAAWSRFTTVCNTAKPWHATAAFVAIAALVQIPVLFLPGYFSHDELQWLGFAERPFAHWQLLELFVDVRQFQYRPVTFSVWLTVSRLFGDSAIAMHLVRGGFGLLNAGLLAYLLVRLQLTRLQSGTAALLFLLTPAAMYTDAWIGTYADAICLLCLLLIGLGVLREKALPRWAMAGLAFVATLIALLSKESGIVFPALLATVYVVRRDNKVWVAGIGSAVAVAIYLALRLDVILFPAVKIDGYAWSFTNIPQRMLEYAVFPFSWNRFEQIALFDRSLAWLALALGAFVFIAVASVGWRWMVALLVGFYAALGPVLILNFSISHYAYVATAVATVILALAWQRMRLLPRWILAIAILVCAIHGCQILRTMYRIGAVQATLYSDILVALKTTSGPIAIKVLLVKDNFIADRLLHSVPSYQGVPFDSRVKFVSIFAELEPATHRMDSKGHLILEKK